MQLLRRTFSAAVAGVASLGAAGAAFAQESGLARGDEPLGQPEPWGTAFQIPATVLGQQVVWFEAYTLAIVTAITLFVLALITIVVVRFNARKSPTPSKTSHNTLVEVAWTVVPVLILVMIAFPSFRLLYNQTTIPEPGLTIKAIGGQWYWNYEYADEGLEDIRITSYMLTDEQRAERMQEFGLDLTDLPRLLATDYPVVAPVGTNVQVLTTSVDVNHNWAMPSFGIKKDAIQGRLNETWFNVLEPGVYFGQCSELCGRNHAFMPIELHALEPERFQEWAELAKTDIDAATAQLRRWQAERGGGEAVAALD